MISVCSSWYVGNYNDNVVLVCVNGKSLWEELFSELFPNTVEFRLRRCLVYTEMMFYTNIACHNALIVSNISWITVISYHFLDVSGVFYSGREEDGREAYNSASVFAEKLFFEESRLDVDEGRTSDRILPFYLDGIVPSAAGTIYFPTILHDKHFRIFAGEKFYRRRERRYIARACAVCV